MLKVFKIAAFLFLPFYSFSQNAIILEPANSEIQNSNGNLSFQNGNVRIGAGILDQSKLTISNVATSNFGLVVHGSSSPDNRFRVAQFVSPNYIYQSSGGGLQFSLLNIGLDPISEINAFAKGKTATSHIVLQNLNNGFVGIGTSYPKSKVHVSSGDVYIDNPNNSVIMKSPNGSCFKLRVTDAGGVYAEAITCPN